MTKPQTILITGATSGIGRDAALYLHERGHRVFATGRNPNALAELRDLGLEALPLDVNDGASIEVLRQEIDERTEGRGLDVLVNNAGYGLFGPVEMLSDEDVRKQFDTNVFGLLAVTRAFLPAMRRNGAGRVLNVSSVGGRITFPLGGVYNATKYALESISDALRMEVRQFGIEVVIIEPGYIQTNFTQTTVDLMAPYRVPGSPYAASLALADDTRGLERFAASPRAVSKAIAKGIESRRPRARYVAPGINAWGPILRAMLPTRLVDWVLSRAAGLTATRPALAS